MAEASVLAPTSTGNTASDALAGKNKSVPPSPEQMAAAEVEAGQTAIQQLKDVSDLGKRREAAFDVERKALTAPQFQSVEAPQAKYTSPFEAWSSSAMTIALLGSLFTRTPMLSAMNAAGAALKAYQSQDKEAFNEAWRRFEIESRNAQTAYQHELQAYNEARADIDKREARSEADIREQREEIMSRWNVIAHATQNVSMIDATKNRDWGRAVQIMDAHQRAADANEDHLNKVNDRKRLNDAIRAYEELPENQSLASRAANINSPDPKTRKDAAAAKWELFNKEVQKGLIKENNNPLKDEKIKASMVAQFEKSPLGKAYFDTKSLSDKIDELEKNKQELYKNYAEQQGLADIYIRMITGRAPTIGQYKTTLAGKGLGGTIEQWASNIDSRKKILLPKEQIETLLTATNRVKNAARNSYYSWLSSPENVSAATTLGILPYPAKSVQDVNDLPAGTPYVTPNGQHFTR
jgi:hypothetical protein